MEEVINGILIREVETKNIMTKSSLPVGGYSVNPYVGCTHACKYCYASFMKRFTGHKEEWGTFLDVKHWPEIKNPKKYAGQRVVIGSVTDGYNPQEEQFGNTRKLLEQLIGSDADILICTKSDLVVRDIDLLKKLGRVTVSWSINTLDENFKNDIGRLNLDGAFGGIPAAADCWPDCRTSSYDSISWCRLWCRTPDRSRRR